MHAQNFARALKLIDKRGDGAAYIARLQLTSGTELVGVLSDIDGVLIWITPEPIGWHYPAPILVDVTYVECITPVYLS